MTKAELIDIISNETGNNFNTTSGIVESFFSVVKRTMTDGENIYIRGFGTFQNKKRAQKIARNISKNTTLVIPEHYVPCFKPAPGFKDTVSIKVKAAGKEKK